MLKSKDKKAAEDKAAKAESGAKKEVGKEVKDPSGKREMVSAHPTRNRAKVKLGDKVYKVVRHVKRKSGIVMLAVPGGESVTEEDWLAGKAHIGLKDEHVWVPSAERHPDPKKVAKEAPKKDEKK